MVERKKGIKEEEKGDYQEGKLGDYIDFVSGNN